MSKKMRLLIGMAALWGQALAADGSDDVDPERTPQARQASGTAVVLDALVVSATRTERPRFTTPASISVLRRDDVET
ncbi:MAG: hypothetical protein ABR550_10130, partial [Wenzhouxiangellaceae bacterium]